MSVLKNITNHIRLLFRKDKEPYLQLKKILGYLPVDIEIYQTAMSHKSLNSKTGNHINNERLEFLGDAVLGSVVADILYERYPDKQEGFLTTLRSKLVRRDMLNRLAEKIGLSELVNYNGKINSAHNSYVNGNAFEAFIGAIYIDRGYKQAQRFIKHKIYDKHVDIAQVEKTEENWKSKIIEWCQKYQLDIQFELISEKVLNDNNTLKFTSRVLIEGVYCGSGEGYSKKESHQEAARQACLHIKRDKVFRRQLISMKAGTSKE